MFIEFLLVNDMHNFGDKDSKWMDTKPVSEEAT